SPNSANVLLGSGKLYGDRLSLVNGLYVRSGEFDLGNCTAFTISPKATVKEKYESMDPARSLYSRAIVQQSHTIKITGDEYSLFNLANALMGSQGSINVTGATVSGTPGETVTTAPIPGAWYSLAYRQVSSLTLQQGATTAVLGTDYLLDAARGRVYIIPGGAITSAGGTLTAGYTYASYTFNTVQGGNLSGVDMYVRFVGNPNKGPTYEGEFWHVQFTPSGDLGFIADDFGNWTIEGMCIADAINHPTEPLYRLIQTA
ncbi:MAG TPA: hypothetical protein VF450_08300, partial [Noviherbaspirillum sp.]